MNTELEDLNQEINKLEQEYGESSLSVKEVLNIPVFKGCKIIAGEEGVLNSCRHLATLETPDGLEWVQGNEFLISAGYALRENENELKSFVLRAHQKGVAAIAIKDNRYMKVIPKEMIDQANEYKIPLIELPYSLIYTEAISRFYEALFYKKNQYILQTKHLHERLLNLVFETKDINGIIEALVTITNSSIIIYDSFFNLLGFNISNKKHNRIIKSFTEQGGLPEYGIDLMDFEIDKGREKFLINSLSITSEDNVVGYMYVISDNKISNLNRNAIKRGCMILSLKMANEGNKYVNEIKIRKTITEIILNNENMHDEFYNNIVNDFDWDKKNKFIGVSISVGGSDMETNQNIIMEFKEELYQLISRFFGKKGYLILERVDKIFVFYSVNNLSDCQELIDKVFSLNRSFKSNVKISFAISRIHNKISDLAKMYNDCYVTSLFNKENKITYYDSIDTIKLLYPLKDERQSKEFYNKTIKILENNDLKAGGSLIETLEFYFESDMNKKLTAQKLYIHIETLRYRLKKIETLTGYSLNTSEGLFVLQMNLKLHRLLNLK